MVIRASTSKEVDALLTELRSAQPIARDGAVARLTVIGVRAVQRLLVLAQDEQAPGTARAAAWKALEAIGDERALGPASAALTGGDPLVAAAAVGTVRAFLRGPHAVDTLDRLTGVALDTARASEVRVAAVRALADVEAATVRPVFATLAADADPAVAMAAGSGGDQDSPDARQIVARAAQGQLPETAAILRGSLARAAADASLTSLHQVIEVVRAKEGELPAERKSEWTAARAAAHLALAHRDSRLALYDLRETIEAAKAPVAVEFLTALSLVGDATCLEPIATAYANGNVPSDDWWQRHLREAFQAIVERHQITKRHAAVKKIQKRWPGVMQGLGSRF